LTSRERVNRMFARQEHDRVPRHETFWDETITRWQGEGLRGGAEAALARLASDLHWIARSDPVPYPGRRDAIDEDAETQIIRDQHGALLRVWKGRSGTPEHLGWECENRSVWEERLKPAMLAVGVGLDVEEALRRFQAGRQADRWCYFTCIEAFEFTRRTLGDVVALTAMLEDREWIRDLARTQMDLVLANFEAAWARGVQPDGVWVFGDMAYNRATLCSPALYRELIWPEHKRLADWAHARGLKVIFHSDGDVNAVIPLYLEAGLDCLQPLEAKAGMDLRQLAPRYGDRLAFFGNVDITVLATNNREAIEQEVRAKLAAGMATRGYLYHSDHSLPPTVSWDTFQFIIELLDRHANYHQSTTCK
jgi:uroporphyrinogen decarboxylase